MRFTLGGMYTGVFIGRLFVMCIELAKVNMFAVFDQRNFSVQRRIHFDFIRRLGGVVTRSVRQEKKFFRGQIFIFCVATAMLVKYMQIGGTRRRGFIRYRVFFPTVGRTRRQSESGADRLMSRDTTYRRTLDSVWLNINCR